MPNLPHPSKHTNTDHRCRAREHEAKSRDKLAAAYQKLAELLVSQGRGSVVHKAEMIEEVLKVVELLKKNIDDLQDVVDDLERDRKEREEMLEKAMKEFGLDEM